MASTVCKACVVPLLAATIALAGTQRYLASAPQLKFSCHLQQDEIRTSEPMVLTMTIKNESQETLLVAVSPTDFLLTADRTLVSLDDAAGRSFQYRSGIRSTVAWGPHDYYPFAPGDSAYWRLLLWWDNLADSTATDSVQAGPCVLRIRMWIPCGDYGTGQGLVWTDSIGFHLVADEAEVKRTAPYREFLREWFWRNGEYIPPLRNGKRVAGGPSARTDSFIRALDKLNAASDSSFPYMAYFIPQAESYTDGWRSKAMADANRFITSHPGNVLSEELSVFLPLIYERNNMPALADSILKVMLARYPRNAYALRYEKGRQAWRERK
jgi:hypothetical protein